MFGTNVTIVVVENIKIVTAIQAAVAKVAQAGNIKTKVAQVHVKVIIHTVFIIIIHHLLFVSY